MLYLKERDQVNEAARRIREEDLAFQFLLKNLTFLVPWMKTNVKKPKDIKTCYGHWLKKNNNLKL